VVDNICCLTSNVSSCRSICPPLWFLRFRCLSPWRGVLSEKHTTLFRIQKVEELVTGNFSVLCTISSSLWACLVALLFLSLYEEGSTIPGWVTEWGSLCVSTIPGWVTEWGSLCVNHPWVGDRVGFSLSCFKHWDCSHSFYVSDNILHKKGGNWLFIN